MSPLLYSDTWHVCVMHIHATANLQPDIMAFLSYWNHSALGLDLSTLTCLLHIFCQTEFALFLSSLSQLLLFVCRFCFLQPIFFFKMNSVTMFFWVSVYQVTREVMWNLAILQFFLFLNIVYLPSLAIISLETLIHAKECHLFCHLIGQGKLLIGCRQNQVHWWGNWCHFKELFTFVRRSWKSTTCVSLGPQCKMLMGIFSISHACQEHSKFSLYLQPGLAIVRCSALWPTDY